MELEHMLALSREEVRAYAPKTLVWAPGGTRRHAALEGVPVDKSYFNWARTLQFDKIKLFFDLGVQTFFSLVLGPPQIQEIGLYQKHIYDGLAQVYDDTSMAFYRDIGAQVRFYGQQHLPFDTEKFAEVERLTAGNGPRVIWWTMVIQRPEEALWDAFQAARDSGAQSFEDAVRAYYGVDVDPVDVFIGFGKLQSGYLMPPLLGERASLYWTTFPSYQIEEEDLRTIFWDHRFGRTTWQSDKSDRYKDIGQSGLRERYQRRGIIGVGERVGTFWHQRGL